MKKLLRLPVDFYVTLLFFGFGIFWLIKAYELKAGYSSNVATNVSFTGPYTFPMIISWIIICSALVNLYQSIRRIAREGIEKDNISAAERRADLLRILGLLAIATAYVVTLKLFGFVPTTMVLIFISLLLFGAKSKKAIVIVSIAAPLLLWVLFKVLIKVQLP